MRQWRKPESHHTGQQAEQQQSRCDGARRKTKSNVKPFLLGEEWFPAKCKVVLSDYNPTGPLVTVDPAFPNAWRREPYYSQILAWARQVQAHGLILQIRIGRRFIVPRPDGSEQEVIRTQASIEGRDEPPTSEQDGISKQGEQ
jgi:hypothetical protein